jgi:hypothetical protein
MKTHVIKVALLSLFATLMVVVSAPAQDQNAPANAPASSDQNTMPAPKKHHIIPFHGKLKSVDTIAMTLTVGKRTFQITSGTKIAHDGEPATLSDGVVGETVRGAYRKTDDGLLQAVSVYFGAKKEANQQPKDSSGN